MYRYVYVCARELFCTFSFAFIYRYDYCMAWHGHGTDMVACVGALRVSRYKKFFSLFHFFLVVNEVQKGQNIKKIPLH